MLAKINLLLTILAKIRLKQGRSQSCYQEIATRIQIDTKNTESVCEVRQNITDEAVPLRV